MRRLLALGLVAVVVTAMAVATSGAGGGPTTYRVDAIFDNAGFLIPGQEVRIAGARAGTVRDVDLTEDRKARIEMEVDERFAPFRSDADCVVQPQSLIGEKFVQCTPGTPRGRPLVARGDTPPTVPVENTHSPVDLDLVFATFRRPERERLTIILNELGSGLSGRAEELSAVIRRANPALGETRRLLGILDRDRARLRTLVTASDRVVAELARRRERLPRFIERAEAVARLTAERRGRLQEGLRGLPPLLAEAEPSLRALERLAGDARPLLGDLREAAPPLRSLAAALPPLADAARPALDRLGETAVTGRRAVRAARPVVADLRRFAADALPTGRLLVTLLESLQERGVVEGLQTFVYHAALATSRFDRFSHILPAHVVLVEGCNQYATEELPQCSSRFAAAREQERSARSRRGGAGGPAERGTRPRGDRRRGGDAPAPREGERPRRGRRLPRVPGLPLVDDLLGGLDERLPDAPRLPRGGRGGEEDGGDGLGDLLEGVFG